MKTNITDSYPLVTQRLTELELTPEIISEIIDTMVAARRSWTFNDVSGAGGTRAYLDGTCRARDLGRPLGWVKNTDGNLESMVHDGRGLRFVVCNANENAGVADSHATNRNPKGPATEQVVAANLEQAEFEGLLAEADAQNVIQFAKTPRPDGLTTWYLMVFANEETYRAELSCPISVEGGYLTNCRERIILIRDGDNDNNLRPRTTVNAAIHGEEFEISVTRKHA